MQMWGIREERNAEKRTVLEAFVGRDHTPETPNVHVHVSYSLLGIKRHSFACAMCMCISVYLMLMFLR